MPLLLQAISIVVFHLTISNLVKISNEYIYYNDRKLSKLFKNT